MTGQCPCWVLPLIRTAGPEVLWFCLRVRQSHPGNAGAPFKLVLKHQASLLGNYDATAMHPVARIDGG